MALRLSEKGYRVAVARSGQALRRRNFAAELLGRATFPVGAPARVPGGTACPFPARRRGIGGRGRGRGSLNYANTLYEPLPAFYEDPQWAGIADWRSELAPYYDASQAGARGSGQPVTYACR